MNDKNKILDDYNSLFEERKQKILNSKSDVVIKGTTYYVSNSGDDNNDGTTPQTSWKTLKKVSDAYLNEGDGVLFKRGDLFRGTVKTKSGVTYSAYSEGEKPKFYGCHKSLSSPELWEIYDEKHNIWKCKEKMLDPGTIVFNDGEFHSRKLIPSYNDRMQFVCRDDESRLFRVENEMTEDLDVYWHYDKILTKAPTKGKDFPIPLIGGDSLGDIYLRCDKGNPGEVFESIESLARTHMFFVGENKNVTIDNVCIKYVGMHGVSAGGYSVGLHVTNCEIGWIGGSIQHYGGTDPNYPQGGRGTVTRFGNGVEIYGGCDDYMVSNNYIYQIYDAGITHQITTNHKVTMTNISYVDNLIERCVYGIEYFLDQINGEDESYMDNVVIKNNFIRLGGYGWGQQRHNKETPALIKGQSYKNTAKKYSILNNIFDRCRYRLLHLVALKKTSLPEMDQNVYIQNVGGMLGQYGENEKREPKIITFDENADETIKCVFKDEKAQVVLVN